MIELDEARGYVLGAVSPVAPVRLPLRVSLGAVLARDVVSRRSVPPFANTAMDGFAVRAADVAAASADAPVTLPVAGVIRAGMAAVDEAPPGAAVRIMTGAPLPPGADAVVMVERTRPAAAGAAGDRGGEAVEILAAVEPGTHIRPAGDDVQEGDVVLRAGEPLGPGQLGLLATIGEPSVWVRPPLRVGVFSTGDELVEVGHDLAPGQIYDSNRLTLLALLQDAGCEGVDLGRIPDDEAAIAAAIRRGVRTCDAVLTTGGVSMGDYDYVKVVLDRLGDMRWMQIAIRPAKPLAFGTVALEPATREATPAKRRPTPVFGLPGNPVSSMVSFELFARPALRKMMGYPAERWDRPRVEAVADDALARRPDGKTHFFRVVCRWDHDAGGYRVTPAGKQGSHQLVAMARANALAELPDGDGVEAGEPVSVLLLR